MDLGDPKGRAVVIHAGGWSVVNRSPVTFRRPKLIRPLPDPVPQGDINVLRDFLPVSDDDWRLLRAWVVGAFIPHFDSPILWFSGPQGSGKSTAARYIVGITDPTDPPLRSEPGQLRDWQASANASHVVGLDNLSNISTWLSDALCRAVTGEGMVNRQLYTDSDVSVLSLHRKILLTTIDAGALNGDLIDRLMPIELSLMADRTRKAESQLTKDYEDQRGYIVGGIFNLLSQVLRVLPDIQPVSTTRLVDFERVMIAVDQVCRDSCDGYDGSTHLILAHRRVNRSSQLVDEDPVARCLYNLVHHPQPGESNYWQGTATELLRRLSNDGLDKKEKLTTQKLGSRLKRLESDLYKAGVRIGWQRTGSRRDICIGPVEEDQNIEQKAVTAVTAVTQSGQEAAGIDPRGNEERGAVRD